MGRPITYSSGSEGRATTQVGRGLVTTSHRPAAPQSTPPATTGARPGPAPQSGQVAFLDPSAYTSEELVRAFYGQVYRRAYGLTRTPQDAEDLTQEVFIRVLRYLPTFAPGSNFVAWINKIATNLYVDRLRRSRHVPVIPMTDDVIERLGTPAASPDEILCRRVLEPDIVCALEAMTPIFREAVLLRDLEGLPYQEIARALELKMGTVSTRIHRGRAELRLALGHCAASHGRVSAPV